VSVGSNDLTKYTLAVVDRGHNARLSERFFNALHPAGLLRRFDSQVVNEADAAGFQASGVAKMRPTPYRPFLLWGPGVPHAECGNRQRSHALRWLPCARWADRGPNAREERKRRSKAKTSDRDAALQERDRRRVCEPASLGGWKVAPAGSAN